MSDCAQVPLIELLLSVPENGRAIFNEGAPDFQSSTNIPYGRLCHEAAQQLASQAERVRKLEAQEPMTLMDEKLIDHITQYRIKACGAWSAARNECGDIDEAQCQIAGALEKQLASAIDELYGICRKQHNQLAQANETIFALQARIEAADKQEHMDYTRPPITSERELELLAVIEQMREALTQMVAYAADMNCGLKIADDALALTPDLSALQEHDVKITREAATPLPENKNNH